MVQQILKDIYQIIYQYFGVNIGIVLMAGIILWLVAGSKNPFYREKMWYGLVFLGYFSFVIELTLLTREAGSRVGVSLKIWETYAPDLYAQCWMVENVLLFIPFGILLPFLWDKMQKAGWMVALSFLFSLGIETTQLLTGRGFFQVDDIWLNVLGALCGYGIWKCSRLVGTAATLCAILFLCLWGMIFGFSAQNGTESGSLSDALAQWVSSCLLQWFHWEVPVGSLTYPIRKTAHMTEYALLWLDTYGMLWFGSSYRRKKNGQQGKAAECTEKNVGKDSAGKTCLWVSIIIALLVSVSDEIHQLFVPGRSGRAIDVGWDMLGVVLCILFFRVVTQVYRAGNN